MMADEFNPADVPFTASRIWSTISTPTGLAPYEPSALARPRNLE
jgi:hypothetical protein